MADCLNDTIVTFLADYQPLPQSVNCLVMGTIDGNHIGSVQSGNPVFPYCNGTVMFVLFPLPVPLMIVMIGQILNQVSSKAHIENLTTLADAENGFFCLCENPGKGKLFLIQFSVNGTASFIFLSKKSRVDVRASRQ